MSCLFVLVLMPVKLRTRQLQSIQIFRIDTRCREVIMQPLIIRFFGEMWVSRRQLRQRSNRINPICLS
jgi:hypothetical protein